VLAGSMRGGGGATAERQQHLHHACVVGQLWWSVGARRVVAQRRGRRLSCVGTVCCALAHNWQTLLAAPGHTAAQGRAQIRRLNTQQPGLGAQGCGVAAWASPSATKAHTLCDPTRRGSCAPHTLPRTRRCTAWGRATDPRATACLSRESTSRMDPSVSEAERAPRRRTSHTKALRGQSLTGTPEGLAVPTKLNFRTCVTALGVRLFTLAASRASFVTRCIANARAGVTQHVSEGWCS